MKIKVCGPPFPLWLRRSRRGDEERGKRTCVRKVNLFGAWVIWLKNHCVHLICSSEAGVWSWEIVVGQGPNHRRQEALKPTKVAIKERHDFGETGTNQLCYSCSQFTCVWSRRVGKKQEAGGGIKELPVTTASKVQAWGFFQTWHLTHCRSCSV